MPVPVQTPVVVYPAAGAGPYAVPFTRHDNADLVVTGRTATGQVVSLTWVMTAAGVQLQPPPAATIAYIVIQRATPRQQVVALRDQAPVPAAAVEGAIDRLTLMVQELAAELTTAVQTDVTEAPPVLPSLAERSSGGLLVFEPGTGNIIRGAELGPGLVFAAGTVACATATAAAATAFPAGTSSIWTGGRATVGDGGAAVYEVVPSVNAAERGVLDVTVGGLARKARLSRGAVLRPEQFGIFPGSADIRQGLADLASELNWRGGGVVEWRENQTYTVDGTLLANGSVNSLVQFDNTAGGKKGLRWRMNGSRIQVTGNLTARTAQVRVLDLLHVKDFEIEGGGIQAVHVDGEFNYGLIGVYMQGGCVDGIVDWSQTSGRAGYEIVRTPGMTWAQRAYGLDLLLDTDRTFYPAAHERNGHECRVRVTAKDAGRSLFLASVQKIGATATVWNSGQYEDVLITCACEPGQAWMSTVSDIDLTYSYTASDDTLPLSACVGMFFQQYVSGSTTPGVMQRVKVAITQDCTSQPGLINQSCAAVYAAVQGFGGAAATTDHGHTLHDIEISVASRGVNNGTGVYLADLWEVGAPGLGATSSVRNIRLTNWQAANAVSLGVRLNWGIVDSGLVLENIFAPTTALTVSGTLARGVLDASRDVTFSNFASHVHTYTSSFLWTDYQRQPHGRVRQSGRVEIPSGTTVLDVTLPVTLRGNAGVVGFEAAATPTGTHVAGSDSELTVGLPTASTLRLTRTSSTLALTVQWAAEGYV